MQSFISLIWFSVALMIFFMLCYDITANTVRPFGATVQVLGILYAFYKGWRRD